MNNSEKKNVIKVDVMTIQRFLPEDLLADTIAFIRELTAQSPSASGHHSTECCTEGAPTTTPTPAKEDNEECALCQNLAASNDSEARNCISQKRNIAGTLPMGFVWSPVYKVIL